jgi:hypothetical protein
MQRGGSLVSVIVVNLILKLTVKSTYSGKRDGCKFMPENLAPFKILGGMSRPNETATTKFILERLGLGYSGG